MSLGRGSGKGGGESNDITGERVGDQYRWGIWREGWKQLGGVVRGSGKGGGESSDMSPGRGWETSIGGESGERAGSS